jgi:hypothetical protein
MDSDIRSANTKTRAEEKDAEDTAAFRTPEEVAAGDTFEPMAGKSADSEDPPIRFDSKKPEDKNPGGWRDKLALHWPPGRKEYITAAVVVVLVAGGAAFAVTRGSSKPVADAKPAKSSPKPVKPTTVPSALTGLPVDPSVNNRPVTGVMIENSIPARPQSGLSQAGVVFEAIAEGGITRFLALYQDTQPSNVGPIRSARPYFEQWNLGFDAGYAHVGGSPEALADIKAWRVRDLDQFFNSGYYHRSPSRVAPHNMYTSIGLLNKLEASKGYKSSNFTGFERKKEAPAKQPPAKGISLYMSGPAYNVHYDYIASSNSYARTEGGTAHMDANGNKRIMPKVVIAMVMHYRLESDGYHSDYSTIGDGPVYIFQDGRVETGRWYKSSMTSQFVFKDASGKIIKLNPGQTWLTAVSGTDRVKYGP